MLTRPTAMVRPGFRRVRPWLFCLALAIAPGCDGALCGKRSPAPAASASAKPPEAEGIDVLNVGGEPRVRLEVGRWSGLRYEQVVETDGSFGITGQPPAKAPTSHATLLIDVVHGSADPIERDVDGRTRRLVEEHGRVQSLRVSSAELPPEVIAGMNQAFALLVGTTTRQWVGENGELVDVTTELVGGKAATPEIKHALDQLFASQRHFPFRLPPAPVGPGAKWKFTQQIDVRGIRTLQVAEMTLSALTKDGAKIGISVRQQAPTQDIPHPLRPGESARVEQYRGDGTGELTVDRLTGVVLDARLATTGSVRLSWLDGAERAEATFMAASVTRIAGRLLGRDDDAGADGASTVLPDGAAEASGAIDAR